MSNKNKAPVDAYSPDEHQRIKDEYAQNEAAMSSLRDEHLEDILIHHKLIDETEKGANYPLHAELDVTLDALNRKVTPLVEKREKMMAELTRLEANKKRIEDESEVRKVMEIVCQQLPTLKQQAEDMAQALGTSDAVRRARDVAILIEQAIEQTKRKPVNYGEVQHSVEGVFEGLKWLERSASSFDTDRYGRDLVA